jgi:UDP-GlcNAc3NAcA epimerase
MKRIITVVGARPQFIKVAAVSKAIRKIPDIEEILVHTGQHYDINMSGTFFEELEIAPPAFNLDVNGGGHGVMTGAMLQLLEPLLENVRPDMVLVYGDTNSTLAGALAAAKLHIPVAHIEAGLRSFNRRMPEEHNRVITDHIADILFTPTKTATENLRREGLETKRIIQVGDVMYDTALYFAEKAKKKSAVLDRLGLKPHEYILATVHRAENTDEPQRLKAICDGLETVAYNFDVIFPIHPRTRSALEKYGIHLNSINIIEPVGYFDMVALECQAAAIATDSGGVQKEAYFHGIPCVTLRDETEWVELVELGWNYLAPPEKGEIASIIPAVIGKAGRQGQPYGNGDAASKIVSSLCNELV